MSKKESKIPQFIQPFLWSYDLSGLDLENHKNLIIQNILNLGSVQATIWLKETYTSEKIKNAIKRSIRSEWSKKSINLWSLVYNVSPKKETRF